MMAAAQLAMFSSESRPKGHLGIEIKTITDNNAEKLTVHPDALLRKQQVAEEQGIAPHTIVIDRRGAEPVYYHRAGVGSFYLRNMERCSTVEELKRKIEG